MIRPQDSYTHKHWGHTVEVTALAGSWVEFAHTQTNELAWLERLVFEQAYTLKDRQSFYLDAFPDLEMRRHEARNQGLLVPREFLAEGGAVDPLPAKR